MLLLNLRTSLPEIFLKKIFSETSRKIHRKISPMESYAHFNKNVFAMNGGNSAGIFLLKAKNGNTRATMCEIYSKLLIKTGVNDVVMVSLLLILNRNFTYCFGVSIVDLELANSGWKLAWLVTRNHALKCFFCALLLCKLGFFLFNCYKFLWLKLINFILFYVTVFDQANSLLQSAYYFCFIYLRKWNVSLTITQLITFYLLLTSSPQDF